MRLGHPAEEVPILQVMETSCGVHASHMACLDLHLSDGKSRPLERAKPDAALEKVLVKSTGPGRRYLPFLSPRKQ